MSVRAYALQLPYTEASPGREQQYYKGLLTTTEHAFVGLGLQMLQEAVGREVRVGFPVGEFRQVCRREGHEQMERSWVHYDATAARFSAIVYLNEPAQCEGGTTFYRHRESGLYHLPEENSELARLVTAKMDMTWAGLINRLADDGFDIAGKWDAVMHVPMAFNRALIFDARLFHARTGGFGQDVRTSRLTQNFFFNL